ncbi:FMN-binding protein [Shewanella sp. Isolate13]|uniref:FMN-binding protein n=1 Tax=Shewanella sp. Isolate13 TaxID=2908531 RepID=UPI001EFD972B|nr:FMN-binding protein [Shewanella sp. Isolate13]MCG9728243.1 FMN-binding protein [Shewanella sp. Isolate13]
MKLPLVIITILSLSLFANIANARGTYQTAEDFINQAYDGNPPKSKVLWIDDETKAVIESILAHSFKKMRLRYWQQDNQSVWVMDEIGKEAPITVGIHVKDSAISQTKVLVYRESRGDEVRHEFFTDQFKSAQLTDDLKLDTHIDGITGATLSVRALTKLSRIALYLDEQITANN